ncbi:MAG: hypothetical protein ACQEVT_15630 [Pseudomonadota bacterium]|uniref:hypothetical protein n=1 Tax=Roseovarius TaxID=74030 RepID=UPI0022A86428|nr:hypothetical protein [Roseovarius sp. EGI FJ00037]MCZ0812293.1 hypothetical protein [Roseovarius sp. EGI FJ00037]
MLRILALLAALGGLAACTNSNDLDKTPAYLGDFSLGHNVVVAPNLTKGPASREASKEEWIAAMTTAIDERFGRYEGERLYHLGVSIEGYVLAITGVPLVASPKSALILKVTVWDDAMQTKLNEEPHQVTVMESVSGSTILGSGLTQTREKQLENLSRNAAKLIQNWLEQQNHEHGWFESGATDATADDTTDDTADGAADRSAAGGDAPAPDDTAAAPPAG